MTRGRNHDAFRISAGAAHGSQGHSVSVWLGWHGRRDAGAGRDRGSCGRRRDLEQRILDQEGRHPLVDVSQADRCAEGRRAGAAGRVLCPRFVGDLAGVRSQRARQRRIFRDERVRPLRLRLLDHGSRELRQVRPHLGQCRYRQRRRGSEGRGRAHRPRDRASRNCTSSASPRARCAPAPMRWCSRSASIGWCSPPSPTRARARRP